MNDNAPLTTEQLRLIALSAEMSRLADTMVRIMEIVTDIVKDDSHE